MMDVPSDPKQAKQWFDAQLKFAADVAELANKHHVDLTIGYISARPVIQERAPASSPGDELHRLFSWLREPLKGFLDRLTPAT